MSTHSIVIPLSDMEKIISLKEEASKSGKRASKSGTAWSLAYKSLSSGARLVPRDLSLPKTETEVLGLRVPERFESLVENVAKEKGMRESDCLAGAILAALNESENALPVSSESDFDAEVNNLFNRVERNPRKEQVTLLERAIKDLSKGRISLLEASTGSGKGLTMVLAAVHAAEEGRRSLVVAPTVTILRQLFAEFQGIKGAPAAQMILGRQEYISELRLKSCIFELSDDAQLCVEEWIKEQEKIDIQSERYQANTLLHKCADIPIHSLHLTANDGEGDLGYDAYKSQFTVSSGCKIVFATHAMLIIDTMYRMKSCYRLLGNAEKMAENVIANESKNNKKITKVEAYNRLFLERIHDVEGVIPGLFDCLFVDEAHQLESIASSTLGDSVSVAAMRMHVNELVKEVGGSEDGFKKHFNKLVRLGENESSIMLKSGSNDALFNIVKKIHGIAETIKKKAQNARKKGKLSNAGQWNLVRLTDQIEVLRRAINLDSRRSNRINATINWTPVRDWPLISINNENVFRELNFIWMSMHSCILMSATLYLPSKTPHGYIQTVLSIPEDRLSVSSPIVTEWLKTRVTLNLPEFIVNGDNRAWLMPPRLGRGGKHTDKSRNEDTRWHDEVASVVESVAKTAVGGTLVLVTSYHSASHLQDRLSDTLGDRLIVQSSKHSLNYYTQKYKKSYTANERPVWIALGAAATGLDLVDNRDDVEDDMVSDLVIPRLPFGVNRSPSHQYRTNRYFFNEASESAIMFRQMIGRLVRQEKTGNKRLWVLDARIVSTVEVNKRHTLLHRKIIEGYKVRVLKKPL